MKKRITVLIAIFSYLLIFSNINAQEGNVKTNEDWIVYTTMSEKGEKSLVIFTEGIRSVLGIDKYTDSGNLIIKLSMEKKIEHSGLLWIEIDENYRVELTPILDFQQNENLFIIKNSESVFELINHFKSGKEVIFFYINRNLDPGVIALDRFSLDGFKESYSVMIKEDYILSKSKIKSQELGTALLDLVFEGKLDKVNELLKKGANPNAYNTLYQTPLHLAASRGFYEISKTLLSYNANINESDIFTGATPLHEAADGGYVEIVELLCENGADVNSINNFQKTALHIAVSKSHIEVIKILQYYNPNIYLLDNNKKTPLDIAKEVGNKEIINLLK